MNSKILDFEVAVKVTSSYYLCIEYFPNYHLIQKCISCFKTAAECVSNEDIKANHLILMAPAVRGEIAAEYHLNYHYLLGFEVRTNSDICSCLAALQ